MAAPLLLKQILKRLPRIIRPLRLLARSLFLQPHANRIKRAVIALVFRRDSRRDRLAALKSARRIEVFTLLAGVQIGSALRALRRSRTQILQQRPAFRASRNRSRPRHIQRPWPKGIFPASRRRLFRLLILSRLASRVLVAALPVFAIGQNASRNASFCAIAAPSTRDSFPRALATRPRIAPSIQRPSEGELSFTYPDATIRIGF